MKEMPNISDTEWVVMKVIWAHSPCTSSKIIEELDGVTKWKPKTIKSLISRLVKKKAIGFKDDERAYIYYPLVTEEECIKAESKSFLEKVFGGKLNIAVANLFENENLSKQQIDELREILDNKDK